MEFLSLTCLETKFLLRYVTEFYVLVYDNNSREADWLNFFVSVIKHDKKTFVMGITNSTNQIQKSFITI